MPLKCWCNWEILRQGAVRCVCVHVDTQSALENDTEELSPLQQGGAISHISFIHLSVSCARNKRLWWSVTQKQLPDGPVVYTQGMLPWRPRGSKGSVPVSIQTQSCLEKPVHQGGKLGASSALALLAMWLLAAPAELPEGNNTVTKIPQEQRRAGLWALFLACSHMWLCKSSWSEAIKSSRGLSPFWLFAALCSAYQGGVRGLPWHSMWSSNRD